MKKRIFSILLTLTMAFAAITVFTAFANAQSDNLTTVNPQNASVQDNSSTTKSDLKQETKQELAPSLNKFCRLRTASYTYASNLWSVYGDLALLARHNYYDADEARAAFTIDLSKCLWAKVK